VWRGTDVLPLTPKAFAVLHYLVKHSGRLVSKEALLAAIWPDTVVGDAVLKTCVREVRKVLGDAVKAPQFIETAHRRGYRFIGEVVSSQPSVVSRQLEENQKAEGEHKWGQVLNYQLFSLSLQPWPDRFVSPTPAPCTM
jgi:DNA-binding winged helix-turn-helix (wHTH) protein